MVSSSDFYWLAATAQAAYSDLDDISADEYVERLKAGVDGNDLFTAEQAEAFAAEWRVVDQLSDSENHNFEDDPLGGGFSATLFQRKTGGHDYVVAFRGTMGVMTDLVPTDVGDIVVDGMASSQIIDLYNYCMALKTPESTTFQLARRESAPLALQAGFDLLGPVNGMLAANAAGYYWDSGVAYRIVFDGPITAGLGMIPPGAELTVTGHSLGGHLAAAFTRLFPGANSEALTINGAGFGLLQTTNVNTFFNQLAGTSSTFVPDKITNLYGDKNPNFITQDLILQQPGGEHLPLFIEQPLLWSETLGHGSGQMVESAAVYDIFIRLDATLQNSSISEVLKRVTPLLEAASAKKVDTLEQTVDAMRRIFGLPVLATNSIDNDGDFYKAVTGLLKDVVFKSLSGRFFISSDPVDASTARGDFGAFLALQYLTPFSLQATDSAALFLLKDANSSLAQLWEADQALTLEQRSRGEGNFTDVYLQDRAELLRLKIELALTDSFTTEQVRYVDDQSKVLEERASGLVIHLGDSGDVTHVVFGKETADVITAPSETQVGHRFYGGGGSDTIRGGVGNDYFEGSTGNDTLIGGKGNDILNGGIGNDHFEFSDGDGFDRIIDSDGQGSFEINGQPCPAGKQVAESSNVWVSQDGKVHFTLSEKDSHGIQSLLISYGNNDRILIENYKEGFFGITLSDYQAPEAIIQPVLGDEKFIVGDGSEVGRTFRSRANGDRPYVNDRSIIMDAAQIYAIDPHHDDVVFTSTPYFEFEGGNRNDSLVGTDWIFREYLSGMDGDDYIDAKGGSDWIFGGEGSDYILGGAGGDLIVTENSDSNDVGCSGNDYVDAGSGVDAVSGGGGDDEIRGGDDKDALTGGAGADKVFGDAGDDFIFGDGYFKEEEDPPVGMDRQFSIRLQADFSAENSSYNDYLDGGDGNDWINGESGSDTIIGGGGDDRLIGDREITENYAHAGEYFVTDFVEMPVEMNGNDIIMAGTGNDYVIGGGGNDVVYGGDGRDYIWGDLEDGQDTVYIGNDILYGDGGDDRIFSGGGDDYLNGGSGDDHVVAGAGNDVLYGGEGRDYLWGDLEDDENAVHTGNDSLFGDGGDDQLISGGGDDYLNGGSGNDLVIAGQGNDTLEGGADDDVLRGGEDDDQISGSDGQDTLLGQAGNDELHGGRGNDYLSGDDSDIDNGHDILFGDEGNDYLLGGGGNDKLTGGRGLDNMSGGAGDDTYAFSKGDSALTVDGYGDSITDSDGKTTIEFGSGISATDISIHQYSNGAVKLQYSINDSLMLFSGFSSNVNIIEFSGGTSINLQDFYANNIQDQIALSSVEAGASLIGSASGNSLSATGGGSVLRGGRGDDTLIGGGGGNIYLYDRGDGVDHIFDSSYIGNGELRAENRIKFGSGIKREDIILALGANNTLEIVVSGVLGGKLIVHNFNSADAENSGRIIDSFEFSDGSTISYLDLVTSGFDVYGGVGDDSLHGSNLSDNLRGSSGSDTLIGGSGNDVLDGGTGNDHLSGGGGSDTYLFGKGSGHDHLNNYDIDASGSNFDIILLDSDVNPNDVTLSRLTDNLVIRLNGTDDRLEVHNYFIQDASSGFSLEYIKFANGVTWTVETVKAKVLAPTTGNDTLIGYAMPDHISGGNGNDELYGYSGNDTLDGGAGNDYLSGGNGSDVYLFSRGFGQDTLNNYDSDTLGTNVDTILFDIDIALTDIEFSRSGHSLFITIDGADDRLEIQNYFYGDGLSGFGIEYINFSDGTSLDLAMLKTMVLSGTANSDTLYGFTSADIITGEGGDDLLYGREDHDTLYGGAGDDSLYGEHGNDHLDGNGGNDTLHGGLGSNTYWFGRGDGQDRVSAIENANHEALNTLRFKQGVSASDISLSRDGGSLVFVIVGTDDKITVDSFFHQDNPDNSLNPLQRVEFFNGLYWDIATLKNMAIEGNDSAQNIFGYSGSDTINAGGGDDQLYGNSGDDTLDGGAGSDYLSGGDGSDVYLFGRGAGQDTIFNYDGDILGVNPDTILLGVDITVTDVTLTRSSDDLVIRINATDDSLEVRNYFYQDGGSSYLVESIVFSNGVVWDLDTVKSKVIAGTPGDDRLIGDAGTNNYSGGLGDDYIDGAGGDDRIDGGFGNDALYGGLGRDTLIGSGGNDFIVDYDGVNRIDPGEGNDTILNNSVSTIISAKGYGLDQANISRIEFSDSTSAEDLRYLRSVSDIVIVNGSNYSDRLTVKNYFSAGSASTRSQYFSLNFINGISISDIPESQMNGVYLDLRTDTYYLSEANYAGRDYSPKADTIGQYGRVSGSGYFIGGSNIGNDILIGSNDRDEIQGRNGDDILYGMAGDDYLTGDNGNDTLIGGQGNDSIYLSSSWSGNKTIVFSNGDGSDRISQFGATALIKIDGYSSEQATYRRGYQDLFIEFKDSSDSIRIDGFFEYGGSYVLTSTSANTSLVFDGEEPLTALDLLAFARQADQAPFVMNDSFSTASGAPLFFDSYALLNNDSDFEYSELSIVEVKSAENGVVKIVGDAIVFLPHNDFVGAASFVYVVSDGVKTSEGMVTVAVHRPYELFEDAHLTVGVQQLLVGDLDASNDGLQITGLGECFNGSAQLNFESGQITFVPDTGFYGYATFEYFVSDGVATSLQTAFVLVGTQNNQSLTGTSGADILEGSLGNDTLSGAGGVDLLVGGKGNDRLNGGSGTDFLYGGLGNDSYVVDNIGDVVSEDSNSGIDIIETSVSLTLSANIENLLLTGSSSIHGTGNELDNTLTGNSGSNTLIGGVGNDLLDGKAGVDTMLGGVGNDTYVVERATDVVTEYASEGFDTIESSVTFTLSDNVENLTLSGSSAINGNGNALDNILIGNSGKNTLVGGGGNDRLDGRAGVDTMRGGIGDDTYVVDTTSDVVTENANEGIDTIESSVTLTLGNNLENLTLTGTGALNGTGNTLNNILAGNAGANSLTSAAGNDRLDGQGAADTLTGGTGNDTYVLGRGYGADTAVENDATAGNTDIAQFLGGISTDQLWFRKLSNNLEVSIIGTSDKLTVKDWYLGNAYHVEQFKTAEGKTLLDSQVQNLVNAMAAFAPPAAGQALLPENYQTALASVIAANWQ